MDITVYGGITYDYVWLEKTSSSLPSTDRNTSYVPESSEDTEFVITFNQGLNSSNAMGGSSAATSVSVYRKWAHDSVKKLVVNVPTSDIPDYIYDYCVVDGERYVYTIDPETSTTIYSPITSDAVDVADAADEAVSATASVGADVVLLLL